MPHQIRESKKYIVVFCEGESEQVYMDFLKKEFRDVAVIKRVNTTGLFAEADRIFRNNKKYIDNAEVTDEIWFFFDVETKDADSWDARAIARCTGPAYANGLSAKWPACVPIPWW